MMNMLLKSYHPKNPGSGCTKNYIGCKMDDVKWEMK
jgi:hypothetical protein